MDVHLTSEVFSPGKQVAVAADVSGDPQWHLFGRSGHSARRYSGRKRDYVRREPGQVYRGRHCAKVNKRITRPIVFVYLSICVGKRNKDIYLQFCCCLLLLKRHITILPCYRR